MKKRKSRWPGLLKGSEGSSIISVMVAFVILLIGIAGFHTSVRTASSLVQRAEMLNAATGEVVRMFYQQYPTRTDWAEQNVILRVYPEGGSTSSSAFTVSGSLNELKYKPTITDPDGKEVSSDNYKYTMYYYK